MERPAHHSKVRIACYYLAKVQSALDEVLGPRARIERASLRLMLDTFNSCKLHDYDRHRWLTIDGKATQALLPEMATAVTK